MIGEWWWWPVLIATGVATGFLNVVAGGGSLLSLPVLILLGLPAPIANGTNRIGILVQNVSAAAAFQRSGLKDNRLSLSLTLCSLPGAMAGAWLGTRLDGPAFNRVLAVVMVMVLITMHKGARPGAGLPAAARRLGLGHLLMLAAGFYGGFIQAGVGFILMMILHRVIGLDLVRVNMHKVIIVGGFTVVALAVFGWRGKIDWWAGSVLAVGNAAGGWLGAHVSLGRGERVIRWVLNATLVALIIKLLI